MSVETRESSAADRGHQPEDTPAGGAAVVLGLILLSVLIVYLVVGAIGHAYNHAFPPAAPGAADLLSVHRLMISPSSTDTLEAQRARLEHEQQRNLEEYRWIDRASGIAAIPVRDAMALVAARGLPQFAPPPAVSPAAAAASPIAPGTGRTAPARRPPRQGPPGKEGRR